MIRRILATEEPRALEFLREVTAAIAQANDEPAIVACAMRVAVPALGAGCALFLDGETGERLTDARDAHHTGEEAWSRLCERTLTRFPLRARSQTLGTLALHFTEPPSEHVEKLASELAARLALALDAVHLRAEAKRSREQQNQLVTELAHDLRNPLNALLMSTGHLLGHPSRELVPPKWHRMVASMNASARRMEHVLASLVDAELFSAGKVQLDRAAHDVPSLLNEVASALQDQVAERNVRIEWPNGPSLSVEIRCDRRRVLHAFRSLVGYALRLCEQKDCVRVQSEVAHDTWRVRIEHPAAQRTPEQVAHLFDRHGPPNSDAVDRFVANQIVTAHRGEIWASDDAIGFSLPLR